MTDESTPQPFCIDRCSASISHFPSRCLSLFVLPWFGTARCRRPLFLPCALPPSPSRLLPLLPEPPFLIYFLSRLARFVCTSSRSVRQILHIIQAHHITKSHIQPNTHTPPHPPLANNPRDLSLSHTHKTQHTTHTHTPTPTHSALPLLTLAGNPKATVETS